MSPGSGRCPADHLHAQAHALVWPRLELFLSSFSSFVLVCLHFFAQPPARSTRRLLDRLRAAHVRLLSPARLFCLAVGNSIMAVPSLSTSFSEPNSRQPLALLISSARARWGCDRRVWLGQICVFADEPDLSCGLVSQQHESVYMKLCCFCSRRLLPNDGLIP